MENRVEQIEARVAWLEKTLADLDEVVRALGDDLRLMRVELTQLRESQEAGSSDLSSGQKWEVPPHY